MNRNLSVVRQQFAQCVFNHKVYEKACDRLEKVQWLIKWVNIIDVFLILVFLILQIKFPDSNIFGGVSVALTVSEIIFLFLQKEFSIEQRAQEFKKIALQFLNLRDKYKNFIVDIIGGLSEDETIWRRDLYQEQYQIIVWLSSQTTYTDYTEAQLSLLWKQNRDEEFTWSDNEINRFLPQELHI